MVLSLGNQKINFLHQLYNAMVLMALPNRDIILPCHGLQILVRNPRRSKIGKAIYRKGLWEPKTTRFISERIKPGMTVLDIGADIGYYTLLFARLVGAKGRVFSFEPIPKANWYLNKNIEINRLDNVKTCAFALFDQAGTVCLEDPFNKSKIDVSKQIISGNDIQVEAKVFDGLKSKEMIDGVDLVKMDVEGAELNVLRGMRHTLDTYHPKILIEVHPILLESFGFLPTHLMEFLITFGYEIEPVDKVKIDFSKGDMTIFCS
jgi:FkbM family methyltransferase